MESGEKAKEIISQLNGKLKWIYPIFFTICCSLAIILTLLYAKFGGIELLLGTILFYVAIPLGLVDAIQFYTKRGRFNPAKQQKEFEEAFEKNADS